MEFTFNTQYTKKAFTAGAKALRKTVRKKKRMGQHIIGILLILFVIFVRTPIFNKDFVLDTGAVISWIAAAFIFICFVFEDKLNSIVAKRALPPGLTNSVTTFSDENYTSQTKLGSTVFYYENITHLAKTKDYYVLIFSKNHVQMYDKNSLEKDKHEAFEQLLQSKTSKVFKKV